MGILSYGYKGSKTPAGKKVIEKIKNVFTGGKQKTTGTGAIKSVPPSVGNKSLSGLKIQVQKTKGSAAKLKQTLWESKRKKREERFTYDKRNTRTKTSNEKRYEEAQIKKD